MVPTLYESRVEGRLTDQAREAFCDMRIEEIPEGATFSGTVIDLLRHGDRRVAPAGIMAQCRMLGLVVVSARRVASSTR